LEGLGVDGMMILKWILNILYIKEIKLDGVDW
jgi:hypothetical protein